VIKRAEAEPVRSQRERPLGWATARAWRTASAPTQPPPGAQPGTQPLAALRAAHSVATRAADAADAADVDPTQPFVAYLAARLGCTQAEVAGPDLGERLAAAGASPALSARIASRVADLLAARYGGRARGPDGPDVRALADELEAALGG
jgi:hypothetical protein